MAISRILAHRMRGERASSSSRESPNSARARLSRSRYAVAAPIALAPRAACVVTRRVPDIDRVPPEPPTPAAPPPPAPPPPPPRLRRGRTEDNGMEDTVG